METVKLVLRFKRIQERGVSVRFAARIRIDGRGRLHIWNSPQAGAEAIDLAEVEFLSIHQPEGASRAA